MKTAFILSALVTGIGSAEPLTDWFAQPEEKRGAIPGLALNTELETSEDVEKARAAVWKAYRNGAVKRGWDKAIPAEPGGMDQWVKDNKISPKTVEIGDKKMLYVVLAKGTKPEGGWPVFFCLHGGGGNANAKGPHTWQVNTREWFAQMQLTTRVWESPGLYIIPRMADDREGRWYYGYNQVFLDRLTQQAILFNDANPDKIYLQGISEGGYAAFRLGSMMADRWAGSCAMAAAEPIRNAPLENLQHVAFRCGIGEKDTMFDRIGLARNYFQKLAELGKKHPGHYKHSFDEQKGKGHGIDYKPVPRGLPNTPAPPCPHTSTGPWSSSTTATATASTGWRLKASKRASHSSSPRRLTRKRTPSPSLPRPRTARTPETIPCAFI